MGCSCQPALTSISIAVGRGTLASLWSWERVDVTPAVGAMRAGYSAASAYLVPGISPKCLLTWPGIPWAETLL